MRKLSYWNTFIIVFLFLILLAPVSSYAYSRSLNSMPEGAEKNAYKMWSVAKALGMNDIQAAGMLGSADVESGFDPTNLEGSFLLAPGESYKVGPKKKKAFKNPEAYTQRLFYAYAHSNPPVPINKDAYIGTDGKHWPAVGLFQFTGPRTSNIINWGKYHKLDWYNIDNQLAYILIKEDPSKCVDGKADWIFNTYIPAKHKSIDKATFEFMKGFEGGNWGYEKRLAAAKKWYKKFKGSKGDTTYAKKVLQLAKHPMSYGVNTDIVDKSILHDNVGKVLLMERNHGFNIDPYGKKAEEQKVANTSVYKNTIGTGGDGKKYSLFDLYGEDIHFYRYLGETTTPVNLLDHIYSAYTQDKLKELSIPKSALYSSKTYLSCRVYPDRPPVLSKNDLTEGKTDPRVIAFDNNMFTGYSYTVGNMYLNTAKGILSFTNLFLGSDVLKAVKDVADNITGSETYGKIFKPVILYFTGFSVIFFIISLFVHAKKYSKGSEHAYPIIVRFFSGALCLGLIFTIVSYPSTFNNVVYKSATIVDSVFNSVLNKSYENDEVISSSDPKNVTHAALWKTAVFEPWCKGQFGGKAYKDLYTQYEQNLSGGKSKLHQSFTKDEEIAQLAEGEYKFNSAKLTGDICVPVGNGVKIRNWAAYLYSCQSKYHIDHSISGGSAEIDKEDIQNKKVSFPNAVTTAYNPDIPADTFRVLDAQMNISPQIYNDKTEVNNYTDSKELKLHYKSQGFYAIIYSMLLIFIWVPIVTKMKSFILLMFTFTQLAFYSLMELFKEGEGMGLHFRKLKYYAIEYFTSCLKIYILVSLYVMLVGNSFFSSFLYALLALVTLQLTPKNIRDTYVNTKHKVKYFANRGKRMVGA